MSGHTMKAFDAELQELAREIADMGALVERQIGDAVTALTRRDVALARRVVAADAGLDRLQLDIEEKAILTIARRQPMAVDLRGIVAVLRIANGLERMGDYAKNIAKRVVAAGGEIGRCRYRAACSIWPTWFLRRSRPCLMPMRGST